MQPTLNGKPLLPGDIVKVDGQLFKLDDSGELRPHNLSDSDRAGHMRVYRHSELHKKKHAIRDAKGNILHEAEYEVTGTLGAEIVNLPKDADFSRGYIQATAAKNLYAHARTEHPTVSRKELRKQARDQVKFLARNQKLKKSEGATE